MCAFVPVSVMRISSRHNHGFTLIEMAIVLVVIGLIVGGVLVGQDLIKAAEVRATISQIEKYNTAANTFRGKYIALPGDMNAATASQFGFAARGQDAGEGDGNGVIEGTYNTNAAGSNCGVCTATGEPVLFWNDLSYANGMNLNLIEGSFNSVGGALGALGDPVPPGLTGTSLTSWFPAAKIGGGKLCVCLEPERHQLLWTFSSDKTPVFSTIFLSRPNSETSL